MLGMVAGGVTCRAIFGRHSEQLREVSAIIKSMLEVQMSEKMVSCPKCGAMNTPTKVFCYACGGILSALAIKQRRIHKQHVRAAVQAVVVLVVLCLLGIGGLVLWPRQGALGIPGTPEHARQTALLLSSFNKMDSDEMAIGRDVRESDLNGYIRHLRLKKLPFDTLSVDLMPDKLSVRVSNKLVSWSCRGYCLVPTLSRDFTLAVSGSVIIEEAALGHFPLPGFLARKSFARLLDALQGTPELDLIAKAQSITIHKDRLHITFGGD